MQPLNLINTIQNLARSDKPAIEAARDAPQKGTPKLEIGQEVQGTVQSKVSEGVFKVQVAGQTLQMRLPGNLQGGDAVRLQVVAVSPRLTFSIIASQNPISKPEQIGSAARMLSNLAEQPLEKPTIQQIAKGSVWPSADQPPDAKQLAAGLRDALANSGLFYESHQAQWVRGERTTAQLLVEPQNLIMGRRGPEGASPGGEPKPGAEVKPGPESQAAARGAQQVALGSVAEEASTPSSSVAGQVAQSRPAGESGLNIARELLPLVQQQLHTLETHQMVWIGQVWPGQVMQWEIQGQPEHHPRQQEERQWSTDMELALPRLGDVHARFVLDSNGLKLTLHAADTQTVDLFNQALPALKDALTAAEVPLAAVRVEQT